MELFLLNVHTPGAWVCIGFAYLNVLQDSMNDNDVFFLFVERTVYIFNLIYIKHNFPMCPSFSLNILFINSPQNQSTKKNCTVRCNIVIIKTFNHYN